MSQTTVVTRKTTAKGKAMQVALRNLCVTVVQKAKAIDPQEEPHKTTALYVKLSQYRQQLAETDQEILQASTDSAKDFVEIENFDGELLECLEELFHHIPADHPLKRSPQAIHLRIPCPEGGDQGDPTTTDKSKVLAKLKLDVFDGRGSSWPLWKTIFENEVLNTELSSEQKFAYLMSNLKKGSYAYKLALTYVGVKGAFELSWKDILDHYESKSDLKSLHMLALRDLQKKFKVEDAKKFRQLEDLLQAVQSRVNALKNLGAEPSSYEALAILGLKESLPYDLLVKYFQDSEADSSLESLLTFLQQECKVRRKSWEACPKTSHPFTNEKKRFTNYSPSPKAESLRKETNFKKRPFSKGKKHSSMMQEGHSGVGDSDIPSSEDLNE